jgi:DNA-binding transcriptional LysR family regulator
LVNLLPKQRWLLVSEDTITGKLLRAWLTRNRLHLEPAMQTDSFDLIANLVSLGFGVSLVPHRVLALHPKSRPVQRITTHPKFSRDLIVIVRKTAALPAVIEAFITNILF